MGIATRAIKLLNEAVSLRGDHREEWKWAIGPMFSEAMRKEAEDTTWDHVPPLDDKHIVCFCGVDGRLNCSIDAFVMELRDGDTVLGTITVI